MRCRAVKVPRLRRRLDDGLARAPRARRHVDGCVLGEVGRELRRQPLDAPRLVAARADRRQRLVPLLLRQRLQQPVQLTAHAHAERARIFRQRTLGARRRRRRCRRRHGDDAFGQLAQALPLVEQAGVDRAQHRAQLLEDVVELVGAQRLGHRLQERLVGLRQVAQQHAFGALQAVVAHVVVERAEALEHLARHRLRADVLLADPRMLGREGVEGVVDEVAERLGPVDLVELLHALGVLDAGGLELVELLGLERGRPARRAPPAGSRGSTRPATARRARRSRSGDRAA